MTEMKIKEIKRLLEEGYEVEVESPDGWVPVTHFVDKGEWDEYILEIDDPRYTPIRCNEDHLFQTTAGWMSAKELIGKDEVNFLTKDGFKEGAVYKTGKKIPIVDIQVDHKNHRYYTEGVSSHNTAVGKSLAMCHMAAAYLAQGYDVLYITLEMAEERIAERIDANLLDVPIDQIENLSRDAYSQKIAKIHKQTTGSLLIKEYPTGQAHSGHFRALLKELKLKKKFTPDVVFVDYLNLASSARIKAMGGTINSYSYIKAVAEELRGLAVEFDVALISATQTTRSGYCLDLDTQVITPSGEKSISNLSVGDLVLSNAGYNKVKTVYPIQEKEVYEIETESGRKIICSAEHIFPTDLGEKNILEGLSIGDRLLLNK